MALQLFLIGFMGSGKTFLAKKIAKKLNYTHIDTDLLIEKTENKSLNSIFFEQGESYFRTLEQKILHTINTQEANVVSTGGGLPCYNDNILWLKSKGLVIYINTPNSVIIDRLTSEQNHRPLIQSLTSEELQLYIEQNTKKRELYYRMADSIINHEESIDTIIAKIQMAFSIKHKK